MYRWAEHHVESGLGADIQWQRDTKVRASLFIQEPEIEQLRQAIAETSEEEHTDSYYEGILVGADVMSGKFHLLLDGDISIKGTMANDLKPLELRNRYKAHIHKTTRIHYSTEEPEIKNHLVSLTEVREP